MWGPAETVRACGYLLIAAGGTVGMALLARSNYLFFHVLAEVFSIVIAFGIFVIAWNTRRFLQNGAVLFLGVASLFIGLVDLVHMLSYRGMDILGVHGANEATQLWIAARYLQAASFLAAPFLLRRRINAYGLFFGYAVVTAALLVTIFTWPLFPACYVEGLGLTRFKVYSEYVISLLFALSALVFIQRRKLLDPSFLRFMVASIALTICSELAFTTYASVFGFMNMVGHLLKIAAFFMLYKALIEIGLSRPYDLLFRELKLHGESLEKAHGVLEGHVRERTAELRGVNEQLRREIGERERAQAHLQAANRMLELLVKKSSRREYLDAVVRQLTEITGCRCVGVRVRDESGNIPYEATQGFDDAFLAHENNLSSTDACACVRVISGIATPDDSNVMSAFGSLHCMDLAKFLESLPEEKRRQYRGHCAKVGFATLVLVPVRYHGEIVGAIHIADERPGAVSATTLGFLELLSPLIGEASHRFTVEEQLRRLNEELEERVRLRTGELAEAHSAAEARAVELEAVNKELESFSYTVSHDLRSPLRAIDGFSRLLETDYSERLDGEALRYIGIVRASVARMGQLIDDLLAFSRVGRQGLRKVPVDLALLVNEVWEHLDSKGDGRDVPLEVGELPAMWGDRAMLRQVLHNLLGNAVKFSSKKPDAKVAVSGWNENGEAVLCVKDNGIGFEMKYAEKIFGVFQRLHRAEEYEGTGVGLAIVKRIVERHGGRVWVDSDSGKGTSMFFTLPKPPDGLEGVSSDSVKGER
jgi:signal transduction histidine kinase